MSKVKGLKDTIEWYDQNAGSYANAAKNLIFSEGIEKFTSLLPASAKILDAGCGSGRDSALLKNKGFEVIGVDLSQGLLAEAKKEYPEVEFVLGDLLDLPFAENSFEGIWAHASLVHFETVDDTKKAISEFYRVLKPRGIVHILVKEKLSKNKTAVVSDTLSHHDRFFQYYSKDEMADMVESVGLEVISAQNGIIDPAGRMDTKWVWVLAGKN